MHLASRWSPEALEAARAIVNGKSAGPPFGVHSGRIDLRRCSLPGVTRLRSKNISGVDFTGTNLAAIHLRSCQVSDCVLDETDLKGARIEKTDLDSCSFTAADLRDAAIGIKGGRFSNCRFAATDFRDALFFAAEFDRCLFDNCRLEGADFSRSSFDRCTFVGELRDVWFRGPDDPGAAHIRGKARPNAMREVDFSEATLTDVTTSGGLDLSTVRLPSDGSHLRVDRLHERLDALEAASAEWPPELGREARVWTTALRRENQQWAIINRAQLVSELGEEGAERFLQALVGN